MRSWANKLNEWLKIAAILHLLIEFVDWSAYVTNLPFYEIIIKREFPIKLCVGINWLKNNK